MRNKFINEMLRESWWGSNQRIFERQERQIIEEHPKINQKSFDHEYPADVESRISPIETD